MLPPPPWYSYLLLLLSLFLFLCSGNKWEMARTPCFIVKSCSLYARQTGESKVACVRTLLCSLGFHLLHLHEEKKLLCCNNTKDIPVDWHWRTQSKHFFFIFFPVEPLLQDNVNDRIIKKGSRYTVMLLYLI